MGVAVLIVAYCLGSAILPIANQLVNDEHWPLPENAIRCQVFTQQQEQLKGIGYTALPKDKNLPPEELRPRHCSYWARTLDKDHMGSGERIKRFLLLLAGRPQPKDPVNQNKIDKILVLFEQEESTVLNQGLEKTEQLRLLHERIVVLRGAVFSGFVLLLIFLFAYFARIHGQPRLSMRTVCGTLLAIWFIAFALFNGRNDLANSSIFDIPVLESLMLVIAVFGMFLVLGGIKTQLFRTRRYVLITLFFTGLTYGGWMWSEIIYDKLVINSFVALPSTPETQKH